MVRRPTPCGGSVARGRIGYRRPSEGSMARLQFDHIWKRYPDGTEAVKDLSLDIPDGEFLVLVGPSGCGKSTALRMVAGLEDISDGKMIIRSEEHTSELQSRQYLVCR